jgi:hypothetical protein
MSFLKMYVDKKPLQIRDDGTDVPKNTRRSGNADIERL